MLMEAANGSYPFHELYYQTIKQTPLRISAPSFIGVP
jgi:hypothetical protein